jgi:hypothetical protein
VQTWRHREKLMNPAGAPARRAPPVQSDEPPVRTLDVLGVVAFAIAFLVGIGALTLLAAIGAAHTFGLSREWEIGLFPGLWFLWLLAVTAKLNLSERAGKVEESQRELRRMRERWAELQARSEAEDADWENWEARLRELSDGD